MKDQDQRSEDRTSLAISNQNENTSNQTTDFLDNSPEAQQAKQLQNMADNSAESLGMQEWQSNVEQSKENTTGLPDDLKTNLEAMSGMSLDQVKVHYNSSKPAKLDAYAYAEFPNIYIAPGQEKHLPEEAAHMIQQMQGRVKPTQEVNGTPINDNASLEKEAIKEGQKASSGVQKNKGKDLVQKKGKGVVQRAKIEQKSHYGTFSVESNAYKFIHSNKMLNFDLDFEPTANANATKIGLVQVIQEQQNGSPTSIDPNSATKTTANGSYIDQFSNNRNPLYATANLAGTEPATDKNKLESYATTNGQHAVKNGSTWTNANIIDTPTVEGGANSKKEFETSALVLEGADKNEYYGSIKWGWNIDNSGTLNKINFDLVSKGLPSKNFMEGAEKWNNGKARGAVVAKANNTDVYSSPGVVAFTLNKDTEALQQKTVSKHSITYVKIKVTSAGPNNNSVGYVKVSDLKDKGDGKPTIDLPLVKAKVPKIGNLPLYKDKNKARTNTNLNITTRMKVLKKEGDMAKVEIVDGVDTTEIGWVEKSKIKDE